MASFVQAPTSMALLRRLDDMANVTQSRGWQALKTRIAARVVEGNRRGLLSGTDGQGRALIPLVSERTGKYKGAYGPPLVPFGERSRFIANFRVEWVKESGRDVLVSGWRGIDDRRGRPFAQYHLVGAGRNPVRNVAGIRPADWSLISQDLTAFAREKDHS